MCIQNRLHMTCVAQLHLKDLLHTVHTIATTLWWEAYSWSADTVSQPDDALPIKIKEVPETGTKRIVLRYFFGKMNYFVPINRLWCRQSIILVGANDTAFHGLRSGNRCTDYLRWCRYLNETPRYNPFLGSSTSGLVGSLGHCAAVPLLATHKPLACDLQQMIMFADAHASLSLYEK